MIEVLVAVAAALVVTFLLISVFNKLEARDLEAVMSKFISSPEPEPEDLYVRVKQELRMFHHVLMRRSGNVGPCETCGRADVQLKYSPEMDVYQCRTCDERDEDTVSMSVQYRGGYYIRETLPAYNRGKIKAPCHVCKTDGDLVVRPFKGRDEWLMVLCWTCLENYWRDYA